MPLIIQIQLVFSFSFRKLRHLLCLCTKRLISMRLESCGSFTNSFRGLQNETTNLCQPKSYIFVIYGTCAFYWYVFQVYRRRFSNWKSVMFPSVVSVFMRRAFHVLYSEATNLCQAKYWIFVIYDVCAFRWYLIHVGTSRFCAQKSRILELRIIIERTFWTSDKRSISFDVS